MTRPCIEPSRRRLEETGAEGALFYLAIPPSVYGTVIEQFGAGGLARSKQGWRRMIVEKPFGTDLASARALNAILHQHFDEEQVFRIDHYLGKETVQNLLVFRFGNGMFEPIWNRRYIDHVQITAAETVGVERRAAYYEGAGALRDMVQNHLMQLLALVAMEPPTAFTASSVRDRKMDALLSVQPLVDEDHGARGVVRAQYARGWVAGGEVPGYREEPDVNPASTTETFVALRTAAGQLAMGRRAVLHPDRETIAEAHHRDCDPVQTPADGDFPACHANSRRSESAHRQRAAG